MAVAAMNRQGMETDAGSGGPRVNVGTREWWLSMAGGAAALAGGVLLYRRLSRANGGGPAVSADRDSDTRQELGGSRGIVVQESVTIARPVAELYRFWRNVENLPRFMRHLESVAIREKGISHWVAKGPAGTRLEWDARIINEVDGKVIGWQSLSGSMVSTAGSVNFDEEGFGTRVTVRLQYNPPAGKLGAAVARFLGEEPAVQIREDLQRLKDLMESRVIL